MEKCVYDVIFKDCDFEVALDRCFSMAMCGTMDMVNKRIERIKFIDSVFNGDGFIAFDTTTYGDFVPFREMTLETNLREM